MRVLDIGARDGFFTFEAERAAAREVVALDNESPHNTGFAIAAELLGSKATYVTENVYSLNPERYGRFDLVLFLGVIYHLRHPLLALDRIHDVCSPEALLLLETHMIDEGLVDEAGDWRGSPTSIPSCPRSRSSSTTPPTCSAATRPRSGRPTASPSRAGCGARASSRSAPGSTPSAAARRLAGASWRRRDERAVDEAASWDMRTWTVEKATAMRLHNHPQVPSRTGRAG